MKVILIALVFNFLIFRVLLVLVLLHLAAERRGTCVLDTLFVRFVDQAGTSQLGGEQGSFVGDRFGKAKCEM